MDASQKRKRKLPNPGIFDPNYSNDPQYGNVSTLKDGLKRIHFFNVSQPGKTRNYERFQIIFPECEVPTIDHRNIDKVTKIKVPVIKNFVVDFVEPNGTRDQIYIGLFECDVFENEFDRWEKDQPDGEDPIENRYIEALFILNKPIAYKAHESEGGMVSNIPERGYICLQNYANIFVGFRNFKGATAYSFNCYVDYEVCDMRYQDAIVWKADFERMISKDLKYRVNADKDGACVISRGELQKDVSADPSKFPTFKNNSKLFKVTERKLTAAGLRGDDFVVTEAAKYLKM